MAPTREELEAWKALPVTRWILAALETAAQAQQQHWQQLSWEANQPDPMRLTEWRSRADAYRAVEETSYERWCEMNADEPQEDQ